MSKRVLILGGTGDARRLAGRLVADGYEVTSSLAGVTSQPLLPDGRVRIGGFGGVAGLVDYIAAEGFDVVVDATHAFAARISANAVEAAERCGVRVVRLERPEWQAGEGDRWWLVGDIAAAVARLEAGARAFLTIGRKEVGLFSVRSDVGVVARMIEAPEIDLPEGWRVVLARPPFSLGDEMDLMRDERVSVLVTKNAGGARPAKLDAARELGLPVIMIGRPEAPDVTTFGTIEELVSWLTGEG